MKLNDYQKKSLPFCIKQEDELIDISILVLGISGEASEIAEKWKKILAYKDGQFSEEDKKAMGKELGDVLWYMSVLADRLGLTLEEVAEQNIAKLSSRSERGTIKGSGDDR